MSELMLEVNKSQLPKQPAFGDGQHIVMVTPAVGEDYWRYRVKLGSNGQAIVGFPKFFTIGIGFAKEEDWNTNLPYQSSAEKIFRHIAHNKGDDDVADENCLAAIRMVQEAAKAAAEAAA